MRTHRCAFGGLELLIVIGSGLFIFVLGLSAYFEADIRWLHFFQAWMYLATIALSLHHNRWGYFIGISAAGFWNYINLFVTTFFPQWTLLAGYISRDWTNSARRPDHRSAGLDRQLSRARWLHLGIRKAGREKPERFSPVRGRDDYHYCLLRC